MASYAVSNYCMVKERTAAAAKKDDVRHDRWRSQSIIKERKASVTKARGFIEMWRFLYPLCTHIGPPI